MGNTNNYYNEFSEYNIKEMRIKFKEDDRFNECGAAGKYEEELDVKTVKKQYKGIDAKQRTKGAGTGTLTPSMHIDYKTYKKMHGMDVNGLKTGIYAYGKNSRHVEFSITMLVEDEDGYEKLKAYPKCIVTSNPKKSVENEKESVETEDLVISLMPDEHDNCVYECLADEVEETIKNQWMSNFSYNLISVAAQEESPEESTEENTDVQVEETQADNTPTA